MAGWEAFGKVMLANDIKPIYGIEGYHAAVHRSVTPGGQKRDGAHLILLAYNDEGLRNIRIMSDLANREGMYYHPRLDFELLEVFSAGVICTTACMSGLVAQGLKPIWEPDKTDLEEPDFTALSKLHRIFDDRLYMEIHAYSDPKQALLNNALMEVARERGIPGVAASDAHYPKKDDYFFHEVLVSMQQKKGLEEHKGDYGAWNDCNRWHPNDLYIMGEDDMRGRLSYLPESFVDECIASTNDIASKCKATLPETRLHLPVFIPREIDAKEAPNNKVRLIDLVYAGLVKRYGTITKEVDERAQFELLAILDAFGEGERGLEDYFLIVWDIVNWCRRRGIRVGPGRGSAGGSIISYALGITQIDPLKYDLYFERFWNPGRTDGLPDIDLDIQKSRRHEVLQYLKDVYGSDNVLPIGNHVRIQPKSSIDSAAMALWGRSHGRYSETEAIKAEINKLVDAGKQPDWETIWEDEEVAANLGEWKAQFPELFGIAEAMTGRLSGYGKHASAVVISDVSLPPYLPCRMAKKETNDIVTQLEMKEVERQGFPKFDLLGLRNLDVLQETVDQVGLSDFDFDSIDYDSLPDDFWHHLEQGKTHGFFQIEDGGAAKRIAKRIKARSIIDLSNIVALNRPGPLRGGVVDRFIARRNGDEPIEVRHPMLFDILEESYGDFLMQEAVLAYFREIGYTLGEADAIRKILGKKLVDEMEAEKPRYIERASAFMSPEIAELIWEDIVAFSKYSFNKAHSVGYGLILAQTMYAKWRWPAEFITASIRTLARSSVQDKMLKIGKFVNEARRLGIKVHPPDINHSDAETSVRDGDIYFGLSDVKFVSEMAAEYIIENRPHTTFEEFTDTIAQASKAHSKIPKAERPPKSPKQRCTKTAIEALLSCGAFDEFGGRDDVGSEKRAAMEEEFIGMALTDPDQDLFSELDIDIDALPGLTLLDGEEPSGTIIDMTGVVDKVEVRTAQRGYYAGSQFAHLTMRWRGDRARMTIFSKQWEKYSFALHFKSLVRCQVKLNDRGPTVEKVELL